MAILRLQLTEDERDQIAVTRNKLERPDGAFVGVAEGVDGIYSENIVVHGYTFQNDLPEVRRRRSVEGNHYETVIGPGFEEGVPEPHQALTGNLDVGSDKQEDVRRCFLPGSDSGCGLGWVKTGDLNIHR